MAVIAAPPPPDPPAVSAALTETEVKVTSGFRGGDGEVIETRAQPAQGAEAGDVGQRAG